MSGENGDRPRLREVGQAYITLAAAEQYARAAASVFADGSVQIEEARRELTELVLEARRTEGDTETPERWRLRRLSIGVDLSLSVVRETSRYEDGAILLVVVACHARAYVARTGKR